MNEEKIIETTTTETGEVKEIEVSNPMNELPEDLPNDSQVTLDIVKEKESVKTEDGSKRGRKSQKNKLYKTEEKIDSLVDKEIEADRNLTSKLNKLKDCKNNLPDDKTLKPGDCVRITAFVGAFLDGTPLSNSLRFTFLYVNSITETTVELKDASGRILGSLARQCVTKINLSKK